MRVNKNIFLIQGINDIMEIVVESELKITNVPWDDSLSNPNSTSYTELKEQLEIDMDKTFCKGSETTKTQSNSSCHTEVSGFTKGSINILFLIIRIDHTEDVLPTEEEILSNLQEAIVSDGIGNFSVSETSLIISK